MSEQDEVKSAATEDASGSPARNASVSTGRKLFSGLNALGWSAGLAVLTAFATCAGMVQEAGRSRALALYSLSRPAIDQRDTYLGMSSILAAVLFSLIPFAVAYFIYRVATWALRKTTLWSWLRGWNRSSERRFSVFSCRIRYQSRGMITRPPRRLWIPWWSQREGAFWSEPLG